MNVFERFSLVMRSNITLLRERVEDPDRMLHQLVIDMEEELERVRKSVAEAMADEILLRKRAVKAREDAEQWLTRTKQALTRNDDVAAKAALEQKGMAEERADQLEREHAKQKEQTDQLRRSVADLDDKIRQAKQKRTLLMARMTRARSAQSVNAALDRATGNFAFAEFSRLEARVERHEAVAEAFDRLDGRDPDEAELARQFEAEERQEKLQRELEELKSRIHSPD